MRDVEVIERYGITMEVYSATHTRPDWVLREENADKDDPLWVRSESRVAVPVVERVMWFDDEDRPENQKVDVHVYATASGYILGSQTDADSLSYELTHPCLISFQGGTIALQPIFNVGYSMRLARSAVHAKQAPSKVVAEQYLGFIVGSRVGLYSLRTK